MENWRSYHSSQRGRGNGGNNNRFFNTRGTRPSSFPREYHQHAPRDNFENYQYYDPEEQVPYYEPLSPPMDSPRNRYRNAVFPEGPRSPPYAPPVRYRNGYRLPDHRRADLMPPASPPNLPPNRRYNDDSSFRGAFSNYGRGARQFDHFSGSRGRMYHWRSRSYYDGGRHNDGESQYLHPNEAGSSHYPHIYRPRQNESERRRSSTVAPEPMLPSTSTSQDVVQNRELYGGPVLADQEPLVAADNVVNASEDLPQVDGGFHRFSRSARNYSHAGRYTFHNYEYVVPKADPLEMYPELLNKNRTNVADNPEDGPFDIINQLVDVPNPSAADVLLVQNENGGLDIAEEIAMDQNVFDFQPPQQSTMFKNDRGASDNSAFAILAGPAVPTTADNDMIPSEMPRSRSVEAHCQRPLYECFSNGRQDVTRLDRPVEPVLVPVHENRREMEASANSAFGIPAAPAVPTTTGNHLNNSGIPRAPTTIEAHSQRPLFESFLNGGQVVTRSDRPVEQFLVEVPVYENRMEMESTVQTDRKILNINNLFMNSLTLRKEHVPIKEVWANNIDAAFRDIRRIIQSTRYIAIDTEFPGVVAKPISCDLRSTEEHHYQILRGNVDLCKMIQLGLSFFDEDGKIPEGFTHSTWQFNFKFHISVDMYAEDSVNMLRRAGVQFDRLAHEGIDPLRFAELLITSGIVLMDRGRFTFIGFHAAMDFGYILKLLTNRALPTLPTEFNGTLDLYFPLRYDVKYLIKDLSEVNGGLTSVAKMLKIERKGSAHQAGSDALLTGQVFFELRKRFPIDLNIFAGHLFGLVE